MAIDESAFGPSDFYGSWSVVKNLIPLLVLYAFAPALADHSAFYAWGLTPVVGLLIYRLTMVMHDCGHLTLFSSRSWNVRIGKLLGFITGVDFERFRNRHWEHHRDFGREGDPQGFHYLATQTMSRPRFLWHVLKPIFGSNVRYVYAESLLSPENFKRLIGAVDILGFIIVQAFIFLLISDVGNHPTLILLPPVAAATFGLFYSQLRGIAEHGTRGVNAVRPEGFVRSHRTEWLGSLFLYDVHFNYHAEHHRYPGIPSCRLPALSLSKGGSGGTFDSMWQTLGRMLARS
jgi:acyl-lipid omega-6 desaturase (Delta-12 desaturase)